MMKLGKQTVFTIAAAVIAAAFASGALAAGQTRGDHHPPDAAAQESQVDKPDAPSGTAQHGDAKKSSGMMGADHMPMMMKMMQDMHGKMMSGDMAMQPKGDNGPSSLALNGIAARMHREMAITYTGNADIDFVKGMIPHHQAAIDMAKTAVAFGKDPDVKKAAEEIIRAQEAEIAWMKDWLKKQGQ